MCCTTDVATFFPSPQLQHFYSTLGCTEQHSTAKAIYELSHLCTQ